MAAVVVQPARSGALLIGALLTGAMPVMHAPPQRAT
jgi:hypothetical protein